MTTLEERFWAKVNKTETCWFWTACIQKRRDGAGAYGLFGADRTVSAHRFSYELHFGPIPEGMCVIHSCDNPACVRPDHLSLGTQAENIADKMSKRREARGSRHGLAKLTEDQVREIRRLYVPRVYPLSRLAKEFGIDKTVVSQIIRRKTWTHI